MVGMPGRSGGGLAKPYWLKVLEGNRSKTKLIPPLHALGKLPKAPAHLSKEQRACWKAIVKSLPPDVLVTADAGIVERGAVAWAAYQYCTIALNKTGFMIRGPMGIQRNPLIGIRLMAAKEMQNACAELGLSPLARSRLGVLEASRAKAADPMELLMSGGRENWSDLSLEAEREVEKEEPYDG